ncbi:MAG: hypothetical protein IJM25_00605 [Eubacterium sp.]|nr:hypothetical protein [Eubacterium sp.]
MRKKRLICIILILSVFLCSCGKKSDSEEQKKRFIDPFQASTSDNDDHSSDISSTADTEQQESDTRDFQPRVSEKIENKLKCKWTIYDKDGTQLYFFIGKKPDSGELTSALRFSSEKKESVEVELSNVVLNHSLCVEDVEIWYYRSDDNVDQKVVTFCKETTWHSSIPFLQDSKLSDISMDLTITDEEDNVISESISFSFPEYDGYDYALVPCRGAFADEQELCDDEELMIKLHFAGANAYENVSISDLEVLLEVKNKTQKQIPFNVDACLINGMYVEVHHPEVTIGGGVTQYVLANVYNMDLDEQQIDEICDLAIDYSTYRRDIVEGVVVNPEGGDYRCHVELAEAGTKKNEVEVGTVLYSKDGLTIGIRSKRVDESSDDIRFTWEFTIMNQSSTKIELEDKNLLINDAAKDAECNAGFSLVILPYGLIGAESTLYFEGGVTAEPGTKRPKLSVGYLFVNGRGEVIAQTDEPIVIDADE